MLFKEMRGVISDFVLEIYILRKVLHENNELHSKHFVSSAFKKNLSWEKTDVHLFVLFESEKSWKRWARLIVFHSTSRKIETIFRMSKYNFGC